MLKKIILFGSVLLLSIVITNAQAFRPYKVAINAGGSVLMIGEITPATHFSAEISVLKFKSKFGIGIGADADITFIDPDILGYHAGLRASLHYGDRNQRTHDIYGGIGLGMPFYDEHIFVNTVFFNAFAGGRILVTKRIGFFGEVAMGAVNARLGLSIII